MTIELRLMTEYLKDAKPIRKYKQLNTSSINGDATAK